MCNLSIERLVKLLAEYKDIDVPTEIVVRDYSVLDKLGIKKQCIFDPFNIPIRQSPYVLYSTPLQAVYVYGHHLPHEIVFIDYKDRQEFLNLKSGTAISWKKGDTGLTIKVGVMHD